MNGKFYVLDTNIVIALFADDIKVKKLIEKADGVFVPVIVLGELFYGAELSTKKELNIKKLQDFSLTCKAIDCNLATAKYYGEIKGGLKRKGTPIPENDIWIAAIAMQYKLPVATRDKHFRSIKGLKIVKW